MLRSLAKGFRGKEFVPAVPLNNHTVILYFSCNAACHSANLFYQRRIIPCYSLFRRINSLFGRKTFPVLTFREFGWKTLKLMHDSTSKIAKPVKKSQIPCYFPCSQGI